MCFIRAKCGSFQPGGGRCSPGPFGVADVPVPVVERNALDRLDGFSSELANIGSHFGYSVPC